MYTVFTGGYNSRHNINFEISRPKGFSKYVLLIIRSLTHFHIDGKTMTIQPNTAIIVPPNVPYGYHGAENEFINDWLHFECDNPFLENRRELLLGRPVPLDNPAHFSQYVQQIIWELHYTGEQFRSQNIDMLMKVLINNLLQATEKEDIPENHNTYASKLQNLRLTMQTQAFKNFTPEELADVLGVSPSYFQYLYKQFFGVPFKTDLIQFRIAYAKELIADTNLKMEQIALLSGYSNEIHFYRQFRSKTGMTPKEYQAAMKGQ